ncbi:MAG: asparagine synthase (glutamine-hydrolyzing) [Planctomycetaceae bacterium]
MCGICGFVGFDDARFSPVTHRMMRTMPHRGPDDEGHEKRLLAARGDSQVVASFGFRRLAILDLTLAGHQPMVDPETGNVLVFNGEIYNYRLIRQRLESRGIVFRSTSDTEVLLRALSLWGVDAFDELDGMYALAFYEARNRRVLLARDPVGIKPLYHARVPGAILFASEIRSLLASGVVSDEFDPAGVASFLAYGAPQDPLTVHKSIRSFPAGTFQWIQATPDARDIVEGDMVEHWHMPPVDLHRDPHDAARSLRKTLDITVQQHLASDVPLAFFLSGGIDSAVIASIAARHLGEVDTFCVGFESPGMASELDLAKATARHIGASHQSVIISQDTIVDTWDRWLSAADRPSVDGLNTFIISKAVRAANAKVAFSGLGADELFGGDWNFFRVPAILRALRVASVVPAGLRRAGMAAMLPLIPRRYQARVRMLSDASATAVDVGLSLKQMLDRDTMRSLGLESHLLPLDEHFLDPAQVLPCTKLSADVFRAVSCIESRLYMGNTLLRDSDTISMAHSSELRVPFVGRRVLEEAARTPGHVHLQGGRTPKRVLRDAVGDLLLPEILNRKKTGFTLPLGDWMFTTLRESCEAGIDGLGAIPFLNHGNARRLWNDLAENRRHSYWMKPLLLVALGNYADRCKRTYLDSAGAIKVRPDHQRLI